MGPSVLDRAVKSVINDTYNEEDFDKVVADLILKEAKEKNEGSTSSASRQSLDKGRRTVTNTRFLNNIVRDVQGHNRAVMASAAASEEKSNRSNRSHARDSQRGNIDRQQSSSSKVRDEIGREEGNSKREGKMRGWSDDEEDSRKESSSKKARREKRSRESQSPDRSRYRYHSESEEEREARRRRDRREDRTRSNEDEADRASRSSKHSHRREKSRKKDDVSTQMSGLPDDDRSSYSKMDRYFERNYDPMLDVRAETREDENGLIEDEGWDRMLQVLRDKEKRKQAKKEGKSKGDRLKVKRESEKGTRRMGTSTDLLDTRYTPKGGLREWDKGKDG